MTPPITADAGSDYRIRRYEPADREDVLALDQLVWERARSERWFAWKYEENPYVDGVPVFVARADGRVVGARPFMGFRLRCGGTTVPALQPSDTMVHPEYRGRGIFTAMNEAALSHYAEAESRLCFNFPNGQSWPGYRKLGWRPVDDRTTYYRVQDVDAVAAAKLDGRAGRLAVRAAAPAVRRVRSAWTGLGSTPEDFTLEREPGAPDTTLAGLYRQAVPDRIHVPRDRDFYEWRLGSPAWQRRTYVARRAGVPVAAVVARTRTTASGLTVTQLADVVPLVGGDDWESALRFLIECVLEDHRDSDVVAAHESPIPDRVLAALGFLPDDAPPLSLFTGQVPTFAVRPLGDIEGGGWELEGHRLTDPSNWLLSFTGRDTA